MNNLKGQCRCGNIHFNIGTNINLSQFQPRQCDCDFCRQYNAAYFSDPEGKLDVVIENKEKIKCCGQGDNLADFLTCNQCDSLIGVFYHDDKQWYGAVNSRNIDSQFADDLTISPKKLSADEKKSRWKELWFAQVNIER
ncbi:MAG: RusA family crossover junction endodeoxyribonuclease [Gammaproteobacteria bacterium]|nr:RusA family crossover junction endodeoxyribonuclease [Gammaproteobacteria bacterium]